MCCTEPIADLPDEVAEALLAYRSERDADPDRLWGDRANIWWRTLVCRCPFLAPERQDELWRRVRSAHLEENEADWTRTDAFGAWVRDVVAADGRPGELSVVGFEPGGGVRVQVADPEWALPGDEPVRRHLLIDSSLPGPLRVRVYAGPQEHGESGTHATEEQQILDLPAAGAALMYLDVTARRPMIVVEADGRQHRLGVLEPVAPTPLRLRSGECARWSVVDERGTARFPSGWPQKWDAHGRPFFHGADVELNVPPGRMRIRTARGLEYIPAEQEVTVATDEPRTVEVSPERWIDPAASGWYGADLHVHMNYGGSLVIGPAEAIEMQDGEGLHLMNLLAANESSSLIYDREMLEAWVDRDLPGSDPDVGRVARVGVEYRNDLLGHVHATGLSAPPSRFHTGHAGSDAEEDWPPNSVALAEFRGMGAVTGYCHPVRQPLSDDAPPDAVFERVRSVECRELVADAALGLVDGIDVVSNLDDRGAAVVFRRLLGAGVRLAATVGTDTMLSFRHVSTYGNPPGWARMYALLGDGPGPRLSVERLKAAVRAGRTMATNGPWLELDVDGRGPGTRLDRSRGDRLEIRARVRGPGVRRLRIYTADGVLAESRIDVDPIDEPLTLTAAAPVGAPDYVVAVADDGTDADTDAEGTGGGTGRGAAADSLPSAGRPELLCHRAMAHTSPVYVDVDGRAVARAADAAWCLRWLDLFEDLVLEHGVFHRPTQRADVLDVIERARVRYRLVG